MTDFSIIKDEQVRKLVEQSSAIALLDEAEKQKYIKKVATADKKTREKIITLFEDEIESQDFDEKEARNALDDLMNQFVQLKKEFKTAVREDAEEDQKEEDDKRQKEVLDQLEEL
jgi:hypothetical protein